MAIPCAPPLPLLPGVIDLTRFPVLAAPPPPPPPPPPLPAYAQPRAVSEFPLGRSTTLYWLATLTRATYSPTGTLFTEAARAVVPSEYPVTFVPNAGLTPGYGVVRMPVGAVVVISGTTNLAQWQEQLFSNALVEITKDETPGLVQASTMQIYKTAAIAIWAALAPLVPLANQILWVGHSMGGALAQLLHAYCSNTANDRTQSRCVSFAAPRAGDAGLVHYMRTGSQVFRRYALADDFVPALPPDLGIFNLAVPAPFQSVSANWSRYRAASVPYYVQANGTTEAGEEPFLPGLVGAAMLRAAAGQPVNITEPHRLRTYTTRYRNAIGGGLFSALTPIDDVRVGELDIVNQQLDAAGII